MQTPRLNLLAALLAALMLQPGLAHAQSAPSSSCGDRRGRGARQLLSRGVWWPCGPADRLPAVAPRPRPRLARPVVFTRRMAAADHDLPDRLPRLGRHHVGLTVRSDWWRITRRDP